MYNLTSTTTYLHSANAILRAIEAEFAGRATGRGKTLEALVMGGPKLPDAPATIIEMPIAPGMADAAERAFDQFARVRSAILHPRDRGRRFQRW